MNEFKTSSMRIAALAVVLGLAGCAGTVSKGVDDQGQAKEVIFPDPVKQATQPEGSYPSTESLRNLRAGLTKTQVFQLLGPPHFVEGFGAREWDYLLHLQGTNVVCQLKLIYDKQTQVGSIYSKPEGCLTVAAGK